MRKFLITFSGAKYEATTSRTVEDAPNLGADEVYVYDDIWMSKHPFRRLNAWLWDHPGERLPNGTYQKRGFGWYSFKPVIMLDALERFAHDGDVVLYLDGDSRPVADFSIIFRIAERDGQMFFKAQTHSNHRWNKEDCLQVMHCKQHQFKDAGVARFFAMKKGTWQTKQFLYEWLTYCTNRYAQTFDGSELQANSVDASQEHHEFIEHRTEQAIMTNLVHRYGYKLWRECDESGNESQDDREGPDGYGQLFEQTRVGSGQDREGSRFRNVPLPVFWAPAPEPTR